MPARDVYHPVVIRALEADGWRITHDPFVIPVGRRQLFVDLGADKLFAAEREGLRIAVEVKTFGGLSDVRSLEEALGQYLLYETFLTEYQADRKLFLALTKEAFDRVFDEPIGKGVMARFSIGLLIFDPNEERIVQWIPEQ